MSASGFLTLSVNIKFKYCVIKLSDVIDLPVSKGISPQCFSPPWVQGMSSVCVCVATVGAQSTLQDAMGSHRGSATVMPITTLEARLVARDVERGLCGFVWGSCCAGEEKDLQRDLPGVLTLHWMIAEGCRGTQACNLLVATI